jgi:hypothetical protein
MRTVAILVAGSLLFVTTACGEGDGDVRATSTSAAATTTTQPPLSAAEFRAKVSEICEKGDAAIEARVQSELRQSAPTAELARELILRTVIPTVKGEITQAKALQGPADLERGLARVLAAAEEGIARLRDKASSADPLSAFVGDPFPEAHAIAAQFGFNGCRYVPE